MQVKNRFRLEHWHVVNAFLMLYDFVMVALAYFAALWIRFECNYNKIPEEYLTPYFKTILFYSVFCVIVFMGLKLYRSIWRFASYSELLRLIVATVITVAVYAIVTYLTIKRMPVSYYVFGGFLQFMLTIDVRFSYRFILLLRGSRSQAEEVQKKVMIVGAGNAGQIILRDLKANVAINEKAVCFIDDNPNKMGRFIDNVPIVGKRDFIPEAVEKYEVKKIYVAIPSATISQKREILNICKETDCELMNLPGIFMDDAQVGLRDMKPVAVEDLLGRDPIKTDLEKVFETIKGKVIMVTGGGGSIGSELCRQIAAHEPKTLIIFDVYENNAYDIQLELKDRYPELDLVTLIGSVRDSRRIFRVFETYHPDIVYHAAAHKHVPLMEDSPCEAIKNNAVGTYKTAYAAMIHGCQRFVLISTDKAVNPTNVMGASKRICEMIVQTFDKKIKEGKAEEIPPLFTHRGTSIAADPKYREALKQTKTEFVAVRFGNVLGSNGSVIPLFKKQIANGGPVTVTHPDIIRYFMTIPEAVGLVLQAGVYAKGGEIFILDMGEPVKIDTLARNLIRLSGHKPDEDIKVVYTGLRPGEKLYEEKLMEEEGLTRTANERIHIGKPLELDADVFLSQLSQLMNTAYTNDDTNMIDMVKKVVNTYQPA